MEENQAPGGVMNAGPFIQGLATKGAVLTNYSAIAHPSQPNYIAIATGDTKGVTDDNPVTVSGPSIADSLSAAGKTFAWYGESGSPQKHQPFQSISGEGQYDQPFSSFPSSFSSLPNVSFVSPNLNDDMHDGTPAQADTWLQQNLGAYATYAEDPANNSALIITTDEDDGSGNNQVATVLIGAGVTPGNYSGATNHYGLGATLAASQGATGPGAEATTAPFSGMFSGGTTTAPAATSATASATTPSAATPTASATPSAPASAAPTSSPGSATPGLPATINAADIQMDVIPASAGTSSSNASSSGAANPMDVMTPGGVAGQYAWQQMTNSMTSAHSLS